MLITFESQAEKDELIAAETANHITAEAYLAELNAGIVDEDE